MTLLDQIRNDLRPIMGKSLQESISNSGKVFNVVLKSIQAVVAEKNLPIDSAVYAETSISKQLQAYHNGEWN